MKAIHIAIAALAVALAIAALDWQQPRPGRLSDPHRQADRAVSARRRH
jgi:hypothetical protein